MANSETYRFLDFQVNICLQLLCGSLCENFMKFIGYTFEKQTLSKANKVQKQLPGVALEKTRVLGKRMCRTHFFNNVSDLKFKTALKKKPQHMCFSWIFKIFKNPYLKEHLQTALSGNWQYFLSSQVCVGKKRCSKQFRKIQEETAM